MKIGRTLIAGGAILLSAALTYGILQHFALRTPAPRPEPPAQVAPQEAANIFHSDAALFTYVQRYGLSHTIKRLHELSAQFGDCHMPAHRAGRFAYSLSLTGAFNSIDPECHAGGFHGAVEAYFKEHGADRLADDVTVICRADLNPFFSHHCIHGIGHGLMAAVNYDLPHALESCDQLKAWRKESCWRGVFMENIVGGLGSHTRHSERPTTYLSSDPQYPCTIIAERYKSACYLLQASRMVQLFGHDFPRIAATCAAAPENHRKVCFESMGREAGGLSRGRPAEAIQACANAPAGTLRTGCVTGIAKDAFWDPSGQDYALSLCAMLTARAEKNACYDSIFLYAPDILPSRKDLENFCARAEAGYRQSCLKTRAAFS